MRTLTLFREFKISTFLRDNIKTKTKRGFQFSIWVAVAVENEFTLSELVAKLLPHGNQAVCLTLIHFFWGRTSGKSKVICAQRGFSPNGETQSNAMCQLLLSVLVGATMSTFL